MKFGNLLSKTNWLKIIIATKKLSVKLYNFCMDFKKISN